MPNTWPRSFETLKEFIAQNPEIEITPNVIAIPGEVRPEFYRLFDNVRVDFLKDNFPASLERGQEISRAFARVYKAAIAASGLESINVRAAVNWFLQDPTNGLIRPLFDPLFNLIRSKWTEAEFTDNSIQIVEDAFTEYFRDGYVRWTVLGLLALMKPDRNYHIETRDYHTDAEMNEGGMPAGQREETVDAIAESKKIVFDVSTLSAFIVPRVLFHSTRLERYVAIHTDFTEAYWRARGKSDRMEWLSLKDIKEEFGRSRLWPDAMIYTSDAIDDLNLVSDYDTVARPDLILEIEEEDGWYEKGGLELARRHLAELKPRLGCYIICRTPPPDEAYDEIMPKPPVATEVALDEMSIQEIPHGNITGDDSRAVPQIIQEPLPPPNPEPDIHILPVGFEFEKLDPVVAALDMLQKRNGGKKK